MSSDLFQHVMIFSLLAGMLLALADRLVRRATANGLPWWSWVIAVGLVGGSIPMAESARLNARERIQKMVMGMGPTYVEELKRAGYDQLSMQTRADDPLYLNLINLQVAWLEANPAIADIYTMVKDDQDRVYLLLDSETDYDRNAAYDDEREQRTPIGEEYDEPSHGLFLAFGGEANFEDEIYTDRWGTWISANYPIPGEDGKVHSILGIDFPAEDWIEAQNRASVTVFGYAGLLVTLLAGMASFYALSRQAIAVRELQAKLAIEQAEQFDELSKAKSAFLANMSHEIRTPLTAILGFADVLTGPYCDQDERIANATTIRRNSEHLLAVINDLLDYSKIESGKFTIEKLSCSPFQLVEEAIEMLHVRAKEKDIKLEVQYDLPLPESIQADPVRLKQIILNLVGNAVKFTHAGGVTVRVSMHDGGAGKLVQFDVIDTGIGLSREQSSRLFVPFQQADNSTSRKFGGSGLGLVISRHFAQMMGGDITIASEKGKGSTFTLEIEPGNIASARMIREQHDIPSFRKPRDWAKELAPKEVNIPARILLAEDGPDNQRLIAYLLRKVGADVTIVGNGRLAFDTALGAWQGGRGFDIVLMDMQMPEMDGYQATHALRKAGYDLPILALTAHALMGEREKCMKAGCDDFLTKPLNKAVMMETIARHFDRLRRASRKAA